jgi:hypothetical protein
MLESLLGSDNLKEEYDYDTAALDYSIVGKSTKPKLDHSKFSCILSETTIKQPSIKKNFMALLYPESLLYN